MSARIVFSFVLLVFLSSCHRSSVLSARYGVDKKVEVARPTYSPLITLAKEHIGKQYKYGATGPESFDCSGFCQYVYRQYGVSIPRTTRTQSDSGKKIQIKKIKAGDLVFFGKSNVNHVGIVSKVNRGDIYMVHASSSRGIEEININENPYWSRRLLSVRRML